MLIEWLPLLLPGFVLGLIHALDADHVMAVSTLANQNPGVKRTLFFSLHWALGHSFMLLLCGCAIFGLGVTIPNPFHTVAEITVGVLLIVLGLAFFWRFRQLKINLKQHDHDGFVHMHWADDSHTKVTPKKNVHKKNTVRANATGKDEMVTIHQPVMIGLLHGLAGSAPALALVPVAASGQLSLAIICLLMFSLGVMLAMLFFGLGFAWIQHGLCRHYRRLFIFCRHGVALAAVIVGIHVIIKTV